MVVSGAPTRQNYFNNFVHYQPIELGCILKSGPENGPRANNATRRTLYITKRKWEPNIHHDS